MTMTASKIFPTPLPEQPDDHSIEVSIVLPCLNEADTVGACVTKAVQALKEAGIHGEVIVADNGSTDGSQAIAEDCGARIVNISDRGYGAALQGGINAARGQFIIMADADDSYDLLETPKFIERLRQGDELVQGCRLPAGGGTVKPGAMPILHRWCGNPAFSFLARWWFHAPVNDIYCGMRGFTRDLYDRLEMRCAGMEFATEMILKAARRNARVSEVPITLHPDGRKAHTPHLRTFRDGWRTLRFFLMFSPRWMFLEPGKLLILLGILGYALALPGLRVHGIHFSAHTLIVSTLLMLCGYQSVIFAIATKTFAISQGLVPEDDRLDRVFHHAVLERVVGIGIVMILGGAALLGIAINAWRLQHFGDLNYEHTMRWVIPGSALIALGVQTFFAGFFIGILNFFRR
jgi:glycosyltransferase involved in cell wall biosynthesis